MNAKKILLTIAALATAICCMSVSAFAANDAEDDNTEYEAIEAIEAIEETENTEDETTPALLSEEDEQALDEEDVWNGETIADADDLFAFADAVNAGDYFTGKTVTLTDDINMNRAEWTPMYRFEGTFEGGNHTISNLTYVANANGQMGFFNQMAGNTNNLTIDGIEADMSSATRFGGFSRIMDGIANNVHVKNINVEAPNDIAYVGGFTSYVNGYATDCSVTNFEISADNSKAMIGGFVGSTNCSHTFKNCDVIGFKAVVVGKNSDAALGGFVGQTQTGWNHPKFIDCDVTGIDFTVSGEQDAAGFAVWPGSHTTATNCHVSGTIDATGLNKTLGAGGFYCQLGWNPDYGQKGHFITDCSADVDITTKIAPAGGFIGSATVYGNGSKYLECTNCTALGDVTAVEGGTADIGGFLGKADRGVYTNCIASGTVTNNGTGNAGQFGGAFYDVKIVYDYRYPAGTHEYEPDEIKVTDSKYTGASKELSFVESIAENVDYEIVFKADSIEAVFEEVTENVPEGEKLYNINLVGADAETINRLNSVDLTFEISNTTGKTEFEIIASNKEVAVAPVNNSEVRYEFHYDGKDNTATDTANIITIGQVKFTGYGVFTFAIDTDADTNEAHATTLDDNIVDTFVPNGEEGVQNGELVIENAVIDTEILVPTRELVINIDFPNTINDNEAAYQDMTVTVAGADLEADLVIELGLNGEITPMEAYVTKTSADKAATAVYENGAYKVTITDLLNVNTAYTVTVEGAGYRTARYTVTMTEDKTLSFWNNVKDNTVEVEEGKASSAKNVTFLAGDIVKDSTINIYDLSAVVSYFGEVELNNAGTQNDYAKYDLNRDGKIDSKDVAYVLVSWGK